VGACKHPWRTLRICFLIPNPKVRSNQDHLLLSYLIEAFVGLFAGLSLEGTALIERKDANRDFYGSPVAARDILGGRVPPPEVASKLYEIIEAAEGLDETGLPENAYVPSSAGARIPVGDGQTVFDADH